METRKSTFERPVINRVNAGLPDKFGMYSRLRSIPEIDGVPVESLIGLYGSPLFVLSEKTIRETMADAKRAFTTRYPKVQFAWSYKTNYLDSVCRVFHQEGSWAEVVSGFEYEKAVANGVEGQFILFNGPGKTTEDIDRAITNGSMIHLDHFDELFLVMGCAERLGKRAKVALRINMDTGIYPRWDRFGFNYENGEAWQAVNKILPDSRLELVGLHTHIGTYILSTNAYAVATTKLAELAVRIQRKFNHTIKYIDLGGGFASRNTLKGAYLPGTDTCPSFDNYAEAITASLVNSEIQQDKMPMLILETGRALIDDAGCLLGTVLANKRLVDGRHSMILDIGVNMLFTSFWYEHAVVPSKETSDYTENTTIYGPLCMNIDVIRDAVQFPVLERGDHVVVTRVGAYNMTQWLQFITYRPNVVMIGMKGAVHVIRKAENYTSLNMHELIPDHLIHFRL